jgi:digalactosyldiacylglycerol synthase
MSPLRLGRRSGEGEGGGEEGSGGEQPVAPWQILAPMLRLPPLLDKLELGGGEGEGGLRKRRRSTSVRDPGRSIAIVTTASLPWMTGTSVNPLLRAAYLARDGTRRVTLLLPWLAPSDQVAVHPSRMFATPAEQGEYVREWVTQRCGFAPDIKLTFYPGRWAPDKCSILPVGDITQYVPDSEADVAVLEEPEHLTWYHHGVRWTDKFKHVVGVVHTNYLEYARREANGNVKEAVLRFVNSWVVRAYCHKVVKLSDAVQQLPRAQTCFVHGVSPRFLAIGEERAQRRARQTAGGEDAAAPAEGQADGEEEKGVYFIGKVVWGKGYTELLDLVQRHCSSHGSQGGAPQLHVDVYGGGDDLAAVQASAASRHLPLDFKGPKDHADAALHGYRVFVNPSLSDVVATTTAEALAMGKWVVVAQHPSNSFFAGRFRNCLVYTTPEEFSAHLEHALSHPPAALSPQEREALTWEAATDRFMDAAEPDDLAQHQQPPSPSGRSRRRRKQPGAALLEGVADWAAAQLHQTLTGMEPLRGLAGAGPNTMRAPDNLDTWRPCRWSGGLVDRKDRVVPSLPLRTKQPPVAAA